MSRDLKAPDHTTLSRRNQIVVVPPLTRAHDGPIDLIVDSTGLKILGRGEWNAHKHKTSKKRRLLDCSVLRHHLLEVLGRFDQRRDHRRRISLVRSLNRDRYNRSCLQIHRVFRFV